MEMQAEELSGPSVVPSVPAPIKVSFRFILSGNFLY